MNKKSQFYIITAVLLMTLAFGAIFSSKATIKSETAFNELWKNYAKEAAFAANQGSFDDFTQKFVVFARTRDKNFKLISVYTSESETRVYNAYGKTININNQLSLPASKGGSLNKTGEIGILTDKDVYYLATPANSVKAIFITESKSAKRVYVYE